MAYNVGAPCCLAGDFHILQFPSERNGADRCTTAMPECSGFIGEMNIVDLSLKEGIHSWSHNQERPSMPCTDRFLISIEWKEHLVMIFKDCYQELPWVIALCCWIC